LILAEEEEKQEERKLTITTNDECSLQNQVN